MSRELMIIIKKDGKEVEKQVNIFLPIIERVLQIIFPMADDVVNA